jgi:hydroxymethylpyrimidine/phosphomethylpyrimidine kinase
MHEDLGRVLILAGSDSGGGAGVQADIKTVTALGGYAATAITAITVQNTLGVQTVHALPPALVAAQARAVLDDIGADAIKTGMLGDRAMVEAVADLLETSAAPAVIDPVMVAKGGARLLDADAVDAVKARLIPRAALLTPNAPEAEALTGIAVADEDGQRRAGEALLALGAAAVLMKGGHIAGDRVVDLLITPVSTTRFESGRIASRNTHGTGCTLASGIATGLAQGLGLERSVARARDYLIEAIRRAPHFGAGHGPVDHGWPMRPGGRERLLDASGPPRGRA